MKLHSYIYPILSGISIVLFACTNDGQKAVGQDEAADTFVNAISIMPIDTANLPKELTYKGLIDTVIHWSDKTGEYIAIRTKTIPFITISKEQNLLQNNVDLYVYCYKMNAQTNYYERIWHLHDFVNDCELDIVAEFFKDVFELTDLNDNGIPEIWTAYRTACRSDISPCEMKIVMYEGGNKYAMRGTQKTTYNLNDPYGGKYTLDKAFLSADSSFVIHAKALWHKYEIEKINVYE